MRYLQTFEYELKKLTRDEKDNVVAEEVLLPETGKPMPRIRLGDKSEVREEVMRINHDLLSAVESRDVVVEIRPFC